MSNDLNLFAQAEKEWDLEKLYNDLALAKVNLFPHKKGELTPTERLHLQGLLSGNSPLAIAKRLFVKAQGLNVTLSNTLYRYVEELTHRPINTISNWREVVDWLEEAGYRNSASVDWGEAPEICSFYGRDTELRQLKQWIINDRCRLVALLGIGGIGKTALATVLVDQIKDQFEWVVWRSLRNCPSIKDLIPGLLPSGAEAQNTTDVDLAVVMQYLRKHRCLIVVDEFEGLLTHYPVGHYRDGHEEYGELLRRVGTERHQSCLLVISREKPRELVLLEGKKCLIRSQLLGSLQGAAKEILKDKDLMDDNDQWQKLIRLYGGNPLALKIVSEIIHDLFNGDVNQFLKQNTTFIDSEFRELLDQQFTRLSEPEKVTVCKIAECSCPISIKTLTEITAAQKFDSGSVEIIESLRRRSLLEKVKGCVDPQFTLHPIVAKYIKKHIIATTK